MRVRFPHRLILLVCAPGFFLGGAEAAEPVAALNTHSPDSFTDTKSEPWVTVQMHRVFADGARQEVELLRPESWVDDLGLTVGATFEFTSSERSFNGTFGIDDISPVEEDLGPLEEDGARMVTGTFVTENAKTYTLTLQDGTEVRGTSGHPLFSMDRNDWAGLGEMQPGERLRTEEGQTVVQSVTEHPERETVFNLEVHGLHQYFVSDAAVLSHNMDGCVWFGDQGSFDDLEHQILEDLAEGSVGDASHELGSVGASSSARAVAPTPNEVNVPAARAQPKRSGRSSALSKANSVFTRALAKYWRGILDRGKISFGRLDTASKLRDEVLELLASGARTGRKRKYQEALTLSEPEFRKWARNHPNNKNPNP